MALAERVQQLKAAARRAFAVRREGTPLSPEETRLLEKIATVTVGRRMAGAAVLFLESAGPMNFLGSQALHFLTPILSLACDAREVEVAARLLERRDAITRLVAMIEAAEAARRSADAGASAR